MSILDQLLRSSFRGVEFWVENESTARGQKVVLHEYPNQDFRYAEGLGKMPPTINLTCIVHGSEYVRKRFSLERALENPEIGTLRHPVYGSIKVRPGKFTVGYSANEIGKFTFNIAFHNTKKEAVTPEPVKALHSTAVSKWSDAINNALEKANEYLTPPVDPLGLGVLVDTMNGVSNAFQDAAAFLPNVLDSVANQFQSFIDKTNETVSVVVQSPDAITESYQTLLIQLDSLKDNGEKIDAYTHLTEHETDIKTDPETGEIITEPRIDPNTGEFITDGLAPPPLPPGKTNTVQRKERETNKLIMNELTRTIGLAGLMKELAFAEFWDIDTLEKEVAKMDSIFDALFVFGVVSDLPSISNDHTIKKSFLDLRVALNDILKEKRDNLWSITDVETPIIPLSVLAYRYYGNLDDLDTVIKINPESTVNGASDSKKMLTE